MSFSYEFPITFGPEDTIRVVNTDPGVSLEPIVPGKPIQAGVKMTTGTIDLASLRIDLALSNLIHRGLLPENDSLLTKAGAKVTLETSERRRPIVSNISKSIVSGNLVLTKVGTSAGEQCVYEIEADIETGASVMGYFKFRKKNAWTLATHDWCTLSNVAGVYLGLEHGTFNTAGYAFLRDNGSGGSIVLGGPLQAYNTPRPNQVEYPFPWVGYDDDSVLQIWLFFNTVGYPGPFSPANVPLLEIWSQGPDMVAPTIHAAIPVGSFGKFPAAPFTNSRSGTSNKTRLFFGNISTAALDVLQLDSWALYPDYRIGAFEGIQRPDHKLVVVPDVPFSYRADSLALPNKSVPGRWFADLDLGSAPTPEFFYDIGRRDVPTYVVLPKEEAGTKSAFYREEPRVEGLLDGIVIEAFMSVEVISKDGVSVGAGFAVSDGVKMYSVVAVETEEESFWAVVEDDTKLNSAADGYHLPGDSTDVHSLKLVRLVIDRHRPPSIGPLVQLYIDDELILTKSVDDDTFPLAASATGKVFFGHLYSPNATSKLNIAFINYITRYLAWESVDGFTPDDGGMEDGVRFTPLIGEFASAVIDDDLLVLSTVQSGDQLFYTLNQSFSGIGGLQIDFRMKVDTYANANGETFAAKCALGTGITVFFGGKVLELGMFDCGVHGRFVGIVPASEADIINQTAIGRAYSARVDWTQMTSYRVVVKAYDKIEVFINGPTGKPAITIPWDVATDGFELPANPIAPPGFLFGNFGLEATSTTSWEYVRWGLSDGYEIALQRKYPDGFPSSAFGGKALLSVNVEQTS